MKRLLMTVLTAGALTAGFAGASSALPGLTRDTSASTSLIEKVARVCTPQGVCYDKYSGRMQPPPYPYYGGGYRPRRVYRDDGYYGPPRRYYREY